MNLIECFVKDTVFVDFGSDITYGFDQQNVDFPSRFPTVEFQLIATSGLCQIADRIRKDAGFKPMHPMDEFTDETCDNEGWYDFYVGINGFTDNHMDSGIEFYVVNADSEDNEARYSIDLTVEEQAAIYTWLDEQCKIYLGKGCEELLAEVGKELEEGSS